MNEKKYDLVVIGTGDAGKEVAYEAAEEGWKVAIVDRQPFGGTCGLRGCVPKKILYTAAELADFNRRMAQKGLNTGDGYFRWKEIQRLRKQSTDKTKEANIKGFKKAGIDAFREVAKFTDRNRLEIEGKILQAEYIHIASGTKPRPLKFPGAQHVITSADFLYLEDLPERIIFAGGGYISFEFAGIAARAGSDVTILHRSGRVLKQFEQDLVKILLKSYAEAGIKVEFNQPLTRLEKKDSKFKATVDYKGKEKAYEADLVVHGAGRVPALEALNPEAGNVKMDYTFVPSAVFTLPVLASVGYTKDQAKEKEFDFRTEFKETSDWFHNSRVNEKHAAHKILVDQKTDKIIGAHILGSHAEELINLFGFAMQNGMKAEDFKHPIYAYPTAASSAQYMIQ